MGASTRAAAQSALRAGLRPTCGDQFADEDLREVADVLRLHRYPDDLPQALAHSPPCPWIYTGALENRPALLEKLAALRPLLGNPGDIVRAVRDPVRLYDALARNGLPALEVRATSEPPPGNGDWMLKPQRGSAGRGIFRWDSTAPNLTELAEPYHFQKRADGQPISALFLAAGGTTAVVGVSEQWIGRAELSAARYAYCGSVGPIDLPERTERQIAQTSATIATEFGLRGLFGIDFLLADDVAWPTEVNPRYTASVEIYERVLELPLIEWHVRSCPAAWESGDGRNIIQQFRTTLEPSRLRHTGRKAAKAIVYAPFRFCAPDLVKLERTPEFAGANVQIADRPAVGLPFTTGSPVCTLLSEQAGSESLATFHRALSTLAIEFERTRF